MSEVEVVDGDDWLKVGDAVVSKRCIVGLDYNPSNKNLQFYGVREDKRITLVSALIADRNEAGRVVSEIYEILEN